MVTPSSSVTSASPPASYLQPGSPFASTDIDPLEREEREKAIQKFMASAELSVVVRGLRARLSYASYKATHNVTGVPIDDLEAKTRPLSTAPLRLIGSKRKASGTTHYYGSTATQGAAARRGGNASPAASSPTHLSPTRFRYADVPGTVTNPAHNLYSTLLGPPPLKQARTVHNSKDPPVPAASRSSAGSRSRHGHRGAAGAASPAVRSIAEGTRANSRNRKEATGRSKLVKAHKGKQKEPVEETADVERQAVATLTSLLQSRPSAASISSPRSSLSTISDSGSFHSFTHYGQGAGVTTAQSLLPSADSFNVHHAARAATPPRGSADNLHTTPRADDEEAANLMLYLHTSPSPVRPTTTRNKDARDLAAFGTMRGANSLRSKGRVLFAGSEGSNSPLKSESSFTVDSFPASQSSQLSQSYHLEHPDDGSRTMVAEPTVIPPTPDSPAPPSTQLLPSPPSPSRASELSSLSGSLQAPPTPGNVPFNLNDFINVSPSPAATTVPRSAISLRSGLGANLRTDLGRKLFEEEQHRHHQLGPDPSSKDGLRSGNGAGVLGASIDLANG
ncbi:hypothetical protein EDD16DRAFT_1477643 [Pisolithus croceorrhizus]|nr:hypothetical protein EDD16DRAFT_1477643 [Pisolithus croceorrhizus]